MGPVCQNSLDLLPEKKATHYSFHYSGVLILLRIPCMLLIPLMWAVSSAG